jgi:hypothetical protein
MRPSKSTDLDQNVATLALFVSHSIAGAIQGTIVRLAADGFFHRYSGAEQRRVFV